MYAGAHVVLAQYLEKICVMTSQPILPNPSSSEQVTFSNSLASLRGTAASFVVIYHAFLLFKVSGLDTPQRHGLNFSEPFHMLVHGLIGFFNGPAAVVLFFVLSGTVLTLSLPLLSFPFALHQLQPSSFSLLSPLPPFSTTPLFPLPLLSSLSVLPVSVRYPLHSST